MNKLITGLTIASGIVAAESFSWRYTYTEGGLPVQGDLEFDQTTMKSELTLNKSSEITPECTYKVLTATLSCVDDTGAAVDSTDCGEVELKTRFATISQECLKEDFQVDFEDKAHVCVGSDIDDQTIYQLKSIDGDAGRIRFGTTETFIPIEDFPVLASGESYDDMFTCEAPTYDIVVPDLENEGSYVAATQAHWTPITSETCDIYPVTYASPALCRDIVNNINYTMEDNLCPIEDKIVAGVCDTIVIKPSEDPVEEVTCPNKISCVVTIGETDITFRQTTEDSVFFQDDSEEYYIHNVLQDACAKILDNGCFEVVNADNSATNEEFCTNLGTFGKMEKKCMNTRTNTEAEAGNCEVADIVDVYCVPTIENIQDDTVYEAENCTKTETTEGVCKFVFEVQNTEVEPSETSSTTLIIDVLQNTIVVGEAEVTIVSELDLYSACTQLLDSKCISETCTLGTAIDDETNVWKSCDEIQTELDNEDCDFSADTCVYQTTALKKCQNREGESQECDSENNTVPTRRCVCKSAFEIKYTYSSPKLACDVENLSMVVVFSENQIPEDATPGDDVSTYCPSVEDGEDEVEDEVKKHFCEEYIASKSTLDQEFEDLKSTLNYDADSETCAMLYSTKSTCCQGEDCIEDDSICLAIGQAEDEIVDENIESCKALSKDIKLNVGCKLDIGTICTEGCRVADNSVNVDTVKCVNSSGVLVNDELCDINGIKVLKECMEDVPSSTAVLLEFCPGALTPEYSWHIPEDAKYTCSRCEDGVKTYESGELKCIIDNNIQNVANYGYEQCSKSEIPLPIDECSLECTEGKTCSDPSLFSLPTENTTTHATCLCINICKHGGTIEDHTKCDECTCKKGYYSKQCECSHGFLRLIFSTSTETPNLADDILATLSREAKLDNVALEVTTATHELNDEFTVVSIKVDSCTKFQTVEEDIVAAFIEIRDGLFKEGNLLKEQAFANFDTTRGITVDFVGCDGVVCINGCRSSSDTCVPVPPKEVDTSDDNTSDDTSDDTTSSALSHFAGAGWIYISLLVIFVVVV